MTHRGLIKKTIVTNETELKNEATRFNYELVRPSIRHLSWAVYEDNYPRCTRSELIDLAGMIPDFFLTAMMDLSHKPKVLRSDVQMVAEAMDKHYGFGALSYPFTDTKIVPDEEYVLRHPEDPDMKPYLAIMLPSNADIICFVYPYALVGLYNSRGDQLVFRMD